MTRQRCAGTVKAKDGVPEHPCTLRASYGPLCLGHAASAGDPAARAEQVRRLEGTGRPKRGDFSAYRDRPVAFAAEVLGVELWGHQRRALEALVEHRRVSWRSCHGAGKTLATICAAVWWALTRPNSLVLVIAPNSKQVRSVIWRGLQSVVRAAPGLKSIVGVAKKKATKKNPAAEPLIEPPGDLPELGWKPTHDRMMIGLTSDSPEGLAGLHAAHVLVVEEEASGIDNRMHEAVLGALTGDSRLLLISNPTQTSGFFFDSHTKKRDLYHCLHTSFSDVPKGIPGLIDESYAAEMRADYGEASSVYMVRVLGEFPSESSDAVIPFSLVEAARARWTAAAATGAAFEAAGELELGVDPARFGDDSSAIVARRGLVALEPITFRHLDGVQLAARVAEVAQRLRKEGETPVVRVDVIGVGASVYDQLLQIDACPMRVEAVNVGEAATDDRFERLRDQVWFGAREWLKAGGALPPDDKLAGELIAPTFRFSPRGRQKVESKDDTKARLRRSPDRADALCLAVFRPAGERTTAEIWRDADHDAMADVWGDAAAAFGRPFGWDV